MQQQQSSAVVVEAPQMVPAAPIPVTASAYPTFPVPAQYAYAVQPYVVRAPVTRFLDRQALILSVTQIIVGLLCIAFQATAIGINEPLSFVGHGIWSGIFVSRLIHIK